MLDFGEDKPVCLQKVDETLRLDNEITHVAVVHVETSTGILNPARQIGELVKKYGKGFILDAVSSYGGLSEDFSLSNADFIVVSSNKCLQGIPGTGYVMANKVALEKTEGNARSLSLDLYAQWREMEDKNGKWRYHCPRSCIEGFKCCFETA